MIRISIALSLLLGCVVVHAEEPAPPEHATPPSAPSPAPGPAQAEQKSVQAWGRDNPDCAEWSDACVACTKEGCSTPGIACMPQQTICRRK